MREQQARVHKPLPVQSATILSPQKLRLVGCRELVKQWKRRATDWFSSRQVHERRLAETVEVGLLEEHSRRIEVVDHLAERRRLDGRPRANLHLRAKVHVLHVALRSHIEMESGRQRDASYAFVIQLVVKVSCVALARADPNATALGVAVAWTDWAGVVRSASAGARKVMVGQA